MVCGSADITIIARIEGVIFALGDIRFHTVPNFIGRGDGRGACIGDTNCDFGDKGFALDTAKIILVIFLMTRNDSLLDMQFAILINRAGTQVAGGRVCRFAW